MSGLHTRFGRLVAAHRRRLGLDQAALADAAGLSKDMVQKIESGSSGSSFETIQRLAAALSVDEAELFTHELPGRPIERRALTDLVAELANLSEPELRWAADILRAALKPRR